MGVYYTPSARINLNTYTSGDQAAEWLGAFKTAVETAGWAQSADTGQLVPSTLAGTTLTVNQVFGYLIYYMNDSQHATKPIYVKFTFTNTSSASYSYRTVMTAQIGFATNGTGSITGWSTTISLMPGTNTDTTTTSEIMASTGEGYLIYGTSEQWISISRMADKNTGILSTNGKVLVVYNQNNAASSNNLLAFDRNGLIYDLGTNAFLVPGGNTYGSYSTSFPNIEIYPATFRVPGETEFQYSPSVHAHWDGEIGNNQEYDMAMLGTTPRHWRSFTNFVAGQANVGTAMSPSFLWEA